MRPNAAHNAPRVLLTAAALLFILCPRLHAEEQVFTVRMTGQAEGVGIAARNNAVAQAEEQIITDVLRSMINITDLAPFRAMLRHASGYIQRYDLLRCDTANNTTTVEIDAYVLEKPLRQDVAAVMLPRMPKHSTILLIVAEQPVPEAPPKVGAGTAFLVLRDGLEKYGFSVVGPETLAPVFTEQQLLGIAAGTIDEGSKFARENLQDVVITGQALSGHEAIPTADDMSKNHARLALRVFSGPDGKMTDALGAEAVVQSVDPLDGGDQAIADAAGKLVTDTTVASVLALLGREKKDRVLLTFEKPGDEAIVHELADSLRRIHGVNGVEEMLVSPALARLQLDYDGSMARLSDTMLLVPLASGTLEVRRAVGREITVVLRR